MFVIDGPEQQFLRYVDRAKDLVIRGGMNIAPAELETLIASQPAVAEVAVVGYPDDVLGEKVCAVVALKPGASLTLAEVIDHLNAQQIATYKLPERLEIVDALPRNPVGKILKRAAARRLATIRRRPHDQRPTKRRSPSSRTSSTPGRPQDWARVESLFAPDGVLQSVMSEPVVGREAFAERLRGARGRARTDPAAHQGDRGHRRAGVRRAGRRLRHQRPPRRGARSSAC